MSFRVTKQRLENQVEYLNKLTGSPANHSYHMDGKWRSNPGHFTLNYDYGQPQLQRICNEAGGVENVLGYRGTKAEVDRMIGAYIKGIELVKRNQSV